MDCANLFNVMRKKTMIVAYRTELVLQGPCQLLFLRVSHTYTSLSHTQTDKRVRKCDLNVVSSNPKSPVEGMADL
jgi:hypothetical protein